MTSSHVAKFYFIELLLIRITCAEFRGRNLGQKPAGIWKIFFARGLKKEFPSKNWKLEH